jgi:hypothetical protein
MAQSAGSLSRVSLIVEHGCLTTVLPLKPAQLCVAISAHDGRANDDLDVTQELPELCKLKTEQLRPVCLDSDVGNQHEVEGRAARGQCEQDPGYDPIFGNALVVGLASVRVVHDASEDPASLRRRVEVLAAQVAHRCQSIAPG